MSTRMFPAETDRPFNKTIFATLSTDILTNADVDAVITNEGNTVELATGDVAVAADRGRILIRNAAGKWRNAEGGLSGQTTIVTDAVAAAMFTLSVPTTLTAFGAILDYMVFVRSTTVVQVEVGSVPLLALNEAGTVTPIILAAPTDKGVDAGGGTNVVAFSAAAVGTLATFSVEANTSLTIAAAHVRWCVRPINGFQDAPVLALPA